MLSTHCKLVGELAKLIGLPPRLSSDNCKKLDEFARSANEKKQAMPAVELNEAAVKMLAKKVKPSLADVEVHRICRKTIV